MEMSANMRRTAMILLPKDIRGAMNTCHYCSQPRKCFYWDKAVSGNVCYDCFESVHNTEQLLVGSKIGIRHPEEGEISPEEDH